MIDIMVVDDEEVIREGIIYSIDWGNYGINIKGEASNGREALEIALEVKPDIVITDIKMPIMDGLEFARSLRSIMPNVKLIILTGYDEFEYAKKAIEVKVSEFVLKPVGAEELVEIILNLKDEIMSEKRKAETFRSHEALLNENMPVIRGRLIKRLTNGFYSEEEKKDILAKIDCLDMDFSGPFYQVFIIAIDDYFLNVGNKPFERKEMIFNSILGSVRQALKLRARGFVCQNEIGLFIAVINREDYLDDLSICKYIQYTISKNLGLSVSVGIGEVKNNIFNIYESYNEAFDALRNRIYKGKNVVINFKEIAENSSQENILSMQNLNKEEKELEICIKMLEQDRINSLLDCLFGKLISMKAEFNNIKSIAIYLIHTTFKCIEKMGINTDERSDIQFDPFHEIEKYETAEDIKQWIKEVIHRLMNIIKSEKSKRYKSIVKIGIDYITKHYNEMLSLTMVAEKVHVTPNYFSRVFKEETGESCIEWINKFRIDKAKEFISDVGLKTYEIAEQVGFNDYKHFLYNFKKYAGCSPTQYKEEQLKALK